MGLDFYLTIGSAPCRSVLLVAKAVGVDLNLKPLDLMAGEHMTPEFIKINPQHTVPTLSDNGFGIWESRAILAYLVNKYGKDDTLYPTEAKARAVVDQRLYFDMGTLYQRFADYYYPVIFGGAPYDAAKKTKIDEAFEFLNQFLDGQTWVAGKNMTIADLAIVASVSTFDVMDYDMSAYPNVQSWYKRVEKAAPGYEETNGAGMKAFKALVDHCVKK